MSSNTGRGPLVAVIVLGQFLAVLSTNVVTVALPSIGESVDASPTGLQWIISAYLLVYGALLISGGVLGDRHGRKRVMLIGMAIFAVGSLVCGLAPSLEVLIAGRLLQGVGPALFQPTSLAIIRVAFEDPRRRSAAIGVWVACSGVALAIGPTIGGVVSDGLGWRWVFLLNIPFALIVLGCGARLIPRMPTPPPRGRFDWLGLSLVTMGLALLSIALIQGQDAGWSSPPIVAVALASAASLAAFALWEQRRPSPLIDVSLFRVPALSGAIVASGAVFFSFIGAIVYLATYFQQVEGMSASEAGLHMLPIGTAFALISPLAGRLSGRSSVRGPIVAGLGICGVATLGLSQVDQGTSALMVALIFAFIGIGAGLTLPALNYLAVSVVSADRAGMVAGMLNTTRQVGQLLGIAILGAIVFGAAPNGGLAEPDQFVAGLHTAMLTAALTLLVAAALAALIIPRRIPDPEAAQPAPKPPSGRIAKALSTASEFLFPGKAPSAISSPSKQHRNPHSPGGSNGMSSTSAPTRSEWTTLATDDGEMQAYLATTTDAPRGAVVVLQEAFGVNAHIQSVTNRLAAAGFLALAPDLFHRTEDGVLEYDDRERAMGLIGSLGAAEITTDVGAAVERAREESGGGPVTVLGFCFGGRAAFTAACVLDGLDAAVSFYGPGVASGPHAVLDRVDAIGARMLLLYGGEDPTISAEDREAIAAALDGAGVDYTSHVYEGAGHAFFCDGRPEAFRPEPSLDAWARLIAFLS